MLKLLPRTVPLMYEQSLTLISRNVCHRKTWCTLVDAIAAVVHNTKDTVSQVEPRSIPSTSLTIEESGTSHASTTLTTEPLVSLHAKIQSGGLGWCQAMAARSSLVDKGLIAIDEYASDDGGCALAEQERGARGRHTQRMLLGWFSSDGIWRHCAYPAKVWQIKNSTKSCKMCK